MSPNTPDDALLTLARNMIGLATRAADQLGQVSVVQLRSLTMLRELQPASLVQLAEGIGVTPSTTSRLVDRLVAARFVERRPSPESRRQIELRLSPEGEATLNRYDALRLAGLTNALEQLPESRRDAVVDALAEFGAVLGGVPTAAVP
jgi:DNA-binding MarR family transcriptional regulator